MPTSYKIGPFRLDAEAEVLFRGSEPVAVGQRAVALLRILAERAGTPVPREALIEAAWPGLAIEDSNLSVQIAALRRLFAREPDGQRWIETLPRRGYRFVGPIDATEPTAASSAEATSDAAPALPLPDKPSIAVLPFDNLSGDPEQEYFADGLAEDIITGLSRFHWFLVIARNSSFAYKGQSIDVKKVRRELGVHYVLEGSVRKAAHRVRVTVQLIESLTGGHVWAERYDRELDDLFALQDELTKAIVAAIAPSFAMAEARRIERKPPENFDAWDCAMRGNWLLSHWSRENNAEARRLFEKALEIDPRSTAALSGLATALTHAITFGWATDISAAGATAYAAGQRALAQNPMDADAHVALASGCVAVRQLDAAIAEFRSALKLNPNLALAEGRLAHVLSWQGYHEEALAHAENAERLSPHDPIMSWWGIARTSIAFGTSDYEEAVEWSKKLTKISPKSPALWRYLAASLAHLGRLEEAQVAKDRLLEVMPHESLRLVRTASFSTARPERMKRYIDGLRKAGVPA